MARRRSTRPTRGRREEAAPVAQPVEAAPLEFAEPELPTRTRSAGRTAGRSSGGGGGGMIGLVVPLAAAVLAAICVLITGFLVAGKAKTAAGNAFDMAGVNTAVALAAIEPDWWEADHGLTRSLYESFLQKKQQKIKETRARSDDKRDIDLLEQNFDKVVADWDLDPKEMDIERDNLIRETNRTRLEKVLQEKFPGSGILYAAIRPSTNSPATIATRSTFDPISGDRVLANGVTSTMVYVGNIPARLYMVPIKDRYEKERGVAQVAIDARVLSAGGGLSTGVIIGTLVALLAVGLVTFLLCMGPAKGISQLTRDVEQIARGDLDTRVSARAGGEVGTLARMIERAMKTFRAVQEQSIAQATAAPIAVAHEAEGVDTATLLPSEPPRLEGYEIEAVHKSCPASANDFYDYFRVDAKSVGIVIADMPHSGPKGTFTAATFRALMRAYAPGDTSPSAVLAKVNRIMAGELKRGDHITAMYAVLDTEKDILAVASAGHLPLIFWKFEKKGSALLNPEGIAIGLDKGPVFEKTVVDKRIKLDKGDRIVLHTDGAVAAVNADGEEYGEQRFYYAVNREAPKNSAAFVNFVANEIDLFHECAIQQDDITLVTVRKVG